MSFALKDLVAAVTGRAAAFRCVTEYQPVAGPHTTVFPSTYEGGKYATVGYRDEKTGYRSDDERGKKLADQVLLDSVQSQANRMELALLDAWYAERIKLPVVTVDFAGNDLEKDLRITSLEAPHRIADAILRDSLLDGVSFRQSELGKTLDHVDLRNATALFRLCPTALVFGIWDSTGPKGGLGAKFQRAVVSEIVALDAQFAVRTASKIDPTEIRRTAGILYRSTTANGIRWTLDPTEALDEVDKNGKPTGKKILFGRNKGKDVAFDPGSDKFPDEGRPSKANHGNIVPSMKNSETNEPLPGGIIMNRALQTTVISLPALRRLRFPLIPGQRSDAKVDAAAQTTLAALALCAAVLTRESGCDLRSRCQLFPSEPIQWEILEKPGEAARKVEIDGDSAIALFNDAVDAAKTAGLPWLDKELVLKPSPQLIDLVQQSQKLATATVGGDE